MVDVVIIAEPIDRIETKHAQTFYAELLNLVESLGSTVRIHHYSTKHGFDFEKAPILICHGTIAAEARKSYQPTYSIILGSRGWSGFNTATYNVLDNTLGSSHPYAVKPNPYHFVMDPGMKAAVAKGVKEGMKMLVPNAEPSKAKTMKAASADGYYSYAHNPALFRGHTLDEYQNLAVGHVYPSITMQSLVKGELMKPALYSALENHSDWMKTKNEESKIKTMLALGDLLGVRHAAVMDHGEDAKAVVGKINHALDKFSAHDMKLAEHIGVMVNTYKARGGEPSHALALATMAYRDSTPMLKTAYAERDKELWHKWNETRHPDDLSRLMKQVQPLVINETNKWQQTGINRKILDGEARLLTYEAITSYDPKKSQLNTHVTNHLQKLNRFAINNQNAIRVQEEKVFQYRKFLHAKNELETKLGRNASADELKEEIMKFGEGTELKDFKPIIENYYSTASEAGGAPVMEELSSDATAMHLAMDAMNDRQKFIFKHSYGFNGAPVKDNSQIASHFGVSAAMISKQKKQIDKIVKDHIDASRYLLSSI